MLKKAGIVVAAATAGLLAVSPLAFAGTNKDWGHASHQGGGDSYSRDANGFIHVSNNDVAVPINALNCNDVPVEVLNILPVQAKDIVAEVAPALGILGKAKTYSDIDQDNSRYCGQADTTVDTTNVGH